jgi:putative Holliday junction resolvase
MPRILAIDYGTKRVGLAVTDPGRRIATALDTVHAAVVLSYLKDYLARETVDCFVVGDPKRLDGSPSSASVETEKFVKQLKKTFPGMAVHRVDERFTSVLARQALIDSGVRKMARRDKALIDRTSAVIILQSYMETLPR